MNRDFQMSNFYWGKASTVSLLNPASDLPQFLEGISKHVDDSMQHAVIPLSLEETTNDSRRN